MKSIFVLVVGLLVATSLTHAQPAAPPGPPPTFKVISKAVPEKGHLVVITFEPRTEQFPFTERINFNGKLVDVTKIATRVVYVAVEITIDIRDSRVITPDGKQLPIDDVWKRAKPGTVFASSGDGAAPAPAYLRALSADTMVIIPSPRKMPEPK